MPQEFTDRCIFPDHDPREDEEVPTDECQQCEGEFPVHRTGLPDALNARGYCVRCAPLWDGEDPNYDPTTDDGREFPFAENH